MDCEDCPGFEAFEAALGSVGQAEKALAGLLRNALVPVEIACLAADSNQSPLIHIKQPRRKTERNEGTKRRDVSGREQ